MHECPECGQACYCDQEDITIAISATECDHDCAADCRYCADEDDDFDLDDYDEAL